MTLRVLRRERLLLGTIRKLYERTRIQYQAISGPMTDLPFRTDPTFVSPDVEDMPFVPLSSYSSGIGTDCVWTGDWSDEQRSACSVQLQALFASCCLIRTISSSSLRSHLKMSRRLTKRFGTQSRCLAHIGVGAILLKIGRVI